MIGINELMKEKGITPQALSRRMKDDKAPFNYSKNNWRNLRLGEVKPQDPYLYIYFAKILNVPVEKIIALYSNYLN